MVKFLVYFTFTKILAVCYRKHTKKQKQKTVYKWFKLQMAIEIVEFFSIHVKIKFKLTFFVFKKCAEYLFNFFLIFAINVRLINKYWKHVGKYHNFKFCPQFLPPF